MLKLVPGEFRQSNIEALSLSLSLTQVYTHLTVLHKQAAGLTPVIDMSSSEDGSVFAVNVT